MLEYMGSMTLELYYNIFDRFRILEVQLITRRDPLFISYSPAILNSIILIQTKSWLQAHR